MSDVIDLVRERSKFYVEMFDHWHRTTGGDLGLDFQLYVELLRHVCLVIPNGLSLSAAADKSRLHGRLVEIAAVAVAACGFMQQAPVGSHLQPYPYFLAKFVKVLGVCVESFDHRKARNSTDSRYYDQRSDPSSGLSIIARRMGYVARRLEELRSYMPQTGPEFELGYADDRPTVELLVGYWICGNETIPEKRPHYDALGLLLVDWSPSDNGTFGALPMQLCDDNQTPVLRKQVLSFMHLADLVHETVYFVTFNGENRRVLELLAGRIDSLSLDQAGVRFGYHHLDSDDDVLLLEARLAS